MLRALGPLTKILIALNAVVWLVLLVGGWSASVQVEGGFWAARVNQELFGVPSGLPVNYLWAVPVLLTPLTSAFLHAGALHLAMNMMVLLVCGGMVERTMGPARMALLYAIAIYAAAALQYWADPFATVPVVGASGAISGILAAYFVLFARRLPRDYGPVPGRAIQMLWLAAAWIALNLLTQLAFSNSSFGVAVYSHIGGFLAGLLLVLPLSAPARQPG